VAVSYSLLALPLYEIDPSVTFSVDAILTSNSLISAAIAHLTLLPSQGDAMFC